MKPQEFRTIRKSLNLSQAKTAEMLGVSLRAVSYYETGGRSIPGPTGAIMRLLDRAIIMGDEIRALCE